MAARIDVISRYPDARAQVKKAEFGRFSFGSKIRDVAIVDSYTISKKLSVEEIKKVQGSLVQGSAEELLNLKNKKFDWILEIGYLPGVTDNIGNTTKETIGDLLDKSFSIDEQVYATKVYLISGKIKKEDVASLSAPLYNPLIQKAHIYRKADLSKNSLPLYIPKVSLSTREKSVAKVDLDISDEELLLIGKQGILNTDGTRRGPLALDLPSLHAIQAYFKAEGRKPTDIELESLAQTWSEHCKHTIFANPIDELSDGLYKSYIQKATKEIRKKKGAKDFCVSVFTDNAGGITFDDKYIVTHKVETHNSPSALDPFGGAITGIVGVNRDAMGFGMGAKPVGNVYGFCFAYPEDKRPLFRDKNLTQKMLSPKRIMEGVIHGVNVGGNCSGIPTVHGFSYFHDRFRGKPLVFVGTLGLIPKKVAGKKSWQKQAHVGDYIVVAGGRVGLDGIHGATFSSVEMDSGSPATAVQIGDPITQKKLSDALVKEARDLGLFSSITDNGAGGISCSVAEMAREVRVGGKKGGCRVDIDKVPVKYHGLVPWQIWISESQERMTLSVPKKNWKAFSSLMKKRGVEATIIGEFTNKPRCEVFSKGEKIMDMDIEFLHHGLPSKSLVTKKPERNFTEPVLPKTKNYSKVLLELLQSHNIGSHAFISKQYDHEVQAGSVMKPLIGKGQIDGTTAIMRPVLDSEKGVAVSSALYPTYSEINPYNMAASAIDTAIRNLVAVGTNPDDVAILDNFCWCSSNDEGRLWELKEAARACYDMATAFATPFISGKDSMFNDFRGYDEKGNQLSISVPPTLLISSIGTIKNVANTVSPEFKMKGDIIYLLGETNDECGGSQYFYNMTRNKDENAVGTNVPRVDAVKNKKLYKALFGAIGKNLLASSMSIAYGGLGIALLKSAIGGRAGIDITLPKIKNLEAGKILFSESQGRLLVSVALEKAKEFEKMMKGNPVYKIGTVTGKDTISIKDSNNSLVARMKINDALTHYKKTFKNY